jgi:hypothetical protein
MQHNMPQTLKLRHFKFNRIISKQVIIERCCNERDCADVLQSIFLMSTVLVHVPYVTEGSYSLLFH